MPNGHGGIPRFGSPAILALALVWLLWLRLSRDAAWTFHAALLVTGLFCWRLAWHVHLYQVMEYGGSYTAAEALAAAKRRFLRTLLLTLLPALGLVYVLWP